MADASTTVKPSLGPGSRYRVVLELLIGTPNGERISYASNHIAITTG
nr:hypothetical protein OG409_02330 [Streptomyces sp. NBC_00974]